jgi:hypothetical protein
MSAPREKSALSYVVYVFIAIFVFTCTGVGFLYWKFTPLYQFDEKTEQVKFFGGYVQLDGKHGTLQVGKKQIQATPTNVQHFEGKTLFREFLGGRGPFSETDAQLAIRVQGGALDLTAASGPSLEWKCETSAIGEPPKVEQLRKQMVLDLSRGAFGHCSVKLPARLTVFVELRSGRVDITKPGFDLNLDARSSKVTYVRDPTRAYRFEPRLDSSRMIGPLQHFPPPAAAEDAVWAGITLQYGTLVLE